MPAKKYISNVAGRKTEVAATIVSSGAPNDGDVVALDSTGKLDLSVLPTGVGPATQTVIASENLTAGDFVNFWNDGGVSKVRKADASAAVAGKECGGFVKASVTAAANASVYLEGKNDALTGLTPGARYYLSGTSAGLATATAPSTSGYCVQFLGIALSATILSFEAGEPLVLA